MLLSEFSMLDLNVLEKYYDLARIVDIDVLDKNQETEAAAGTTAELFSCCGQRCEECLCRQAVEHKETLVKTEVLDGKVFLVTAMPVRFEGRSAALELIKAVSAKGLESLCAMPKENSKMYRSLAKLHDLATRDALTNIYNRRHIDEQLPREIMQAKQRGQPFSILMADIDWFKSVNDKYGHAVGDEILQSFAALLENNIRKNNGDWVARYGGEEFLLFLGNCGSKLAYLIGEKLRRLIETTTFATQAGEIAITASFGIYTYSKQVASMRQLMDKADLHLYRAKQAGRNCIFGGAKRYGVIWTTGNKLRKKKTE